MKFLIAGMGSIGRRHLRNLLSLGERDILLYRTGKSTLPDAELEGLPVEFNLDAALAHRPDAVIISNPTSLHFDVALPAAEAGCHILLEKPVSHSLDGVEELEAALARSQNRLLVGYQFRFHPALQQVSRLLSQGTIGKLLSVHAHWGDYLPGWHPWEDYRQAYSARSDLGGGVTLTLSHSFDYLRWLLGEVEALWAFAGCLSDLIISVEDTAEIGLRFANGVLGSLHLDYNQRPPSHHLEIIGDQGTIRWDNASGTASVFSALHDSNSAKLDWVHFPCPEGFERNHLFVTEMRHFLDVVDGKAEPVCNFIDGCQALRLALAALHSADKRELVYL